MGRAWKPSLVLFASAWIVFCLSGLSSIPGTQSERGHSVMLRPSAGNHRTRMSPAPGPQQQPRPLRKAEAAHGQRPRISLGDTRTSLP